MSRLSRLAYCGLGKEATMGTPVVPTVFPPLTGNSPEDLTAPLRDESQRGNDARLQGLWPGVAESTYDHAGMVHLDSFGHYLRAIIGPDTVGAAVAGLSPHTFKGSNAQPPTYTLTGFNTLEARAFPGCMLQDLNLKIDTKGAVTFDGKWNGWQSAPAATPVPPFTALTPLLGWQLTWSAGGAATTAVETVDLKWNRPIDILAGSDGSQTPRESFGEDIAFTASGKMLFEDNLTAQRFFTYAQAAAVATLTPPASLGGGSLQVTATKAVWHKFKVDVSGKYAVADFDLEGVYNTTDGGPALVLLTGPQATAY